MIKLVLWDYTGQSAAWCENFLRPNVAEIVRTLKPDDPDQAEVIMRGDWDFVLIFDDDESREVFGEILSTMRDMNVSTDKIIFVESLIYWVRNPDAVYTLLNPATETAEQIYRYLTLKSHSRWNHYATCDAEGLHYVGTSRNKIIIPTTYLKGKNYVADDMRTFHALAKKFYGVDDSDGYFLDLGANIGTSGIYFVKKLAPNLKLFAVEPDAENFKLLRVNLILNDMDTRTTLVNCGLGENFDEMTMYINPKNPGNNNVIKYFDETSTETIPIAPLDYLLAESEIAPEEVKYVWIDTEGFEAQVLLGAKNLLAKSFVPVFMECNPLAWKNFGVLDKMVDFLQSVGYERYIWVKELSKTGNEIIYPIENLFDFVNYANPPLGKNGDIFLIKNR